MREVPASLPPAVVARRAPWPKRDVIETPLDAVFDVNGWDLIKAVRLLLKGNAVVVEWLRSPVVYSGDENFRAGLLELASDVWNPALIGRHYLHVGRQNWTPAADDMSIKKIFYSLLLLQSCTGGACTPTRQFHTRTGPRGHPAPNRAVRRG